MQALSKVKSWQPKPKVKIDQETQTQVQSEMLSISDTKGLSHALSRLAILQISNQSHKIIAKEKDEILEDDRKDKGVIMF